MGEAVVNEVFDLDAVAREAAAEMGEPFRFKFGGEDYELPRSVDLRAVAALSAQPAPRVDEALRIMLGKEQWERMIQADAVFNDKVFGALLDHYMAHIGTSTGNS